MNTKPSTNFAYLAHHDARLVALATQAEEFFAADPAVCLSKLRLFAELLAKRAAAKVGLLPNPGETQQTLVDRLFERNVIGATQRSLFHDLRRVGNAAVHEGAGEAGEALHQLRMARELGVWFQRSFGNNRKFDPGPFVPPAQPTKANAPVDTELARLRADLESRAKEAEAAKLAVEEIRRAAEQEAAQRLTAEERAAKAHEDAAIWQALANEEIDGHKKLAATEAAKAAELEEQNKEAARRARRSASRRPGDAGEAARGRDRACGRGERGHPSRRGCHPQAH